MTDQSEPTKAKQKAKAETPEEQELTEKVEEIGGPKGDPTRFGDWQVKGRVSDF